MLGLLVIACSSFSLGYGFLSILKKRGSNFRDILLLSGATGLGLWCFILFLLGHLHLLNRDLLIILTITFSLPLPFILNIIIKDTKWKPFSQKQSFTEWLLLMVILLILTLTFLSSFAPVTGGLSNDEIHTHLTVPKEWLSNGNLDPLPYAVSFQAGNGHLLFLLGSLFSPESGPKLISWFAFVLCLITVYSISRLYFCTKTSLLAITLVAINPLLFRGANAAFVDELSSLFAVLPVLMAALYFKKPSRTYLILCAFFLGIGCGIKPTNILYTFSIITCILFVLLKKQGPAATVKNGLFLISLTALFLSPWPVRNLLLTGCPVFPPPLFWYKVFDIRPMMGIEMPFTLMEVKGYYDYCTSRYGDYHRGLLQVIRFPWDITMNPERFQIGDSVGTVMLSLLPLLLFAPVAVPWFLLGITVFSSVLIYFLVLPEARYYMAAFMLISPVLAAIAVSLEKIKSLRLLIRFILIVNIVFSLLIAGRITFDKIRGIRGDAREKYKQARIPYYETFKYIKENNIKNVNVFFFHPVFYYLSSSYSIHKNPDSLAQLPDSSYILDIDYSQVFDRDFSVQTHSYNVRSPENLELVFEGKDAKLYRYIKAKKKNIQSETIE